MHNYKSEHGGLAQTNKASLSDFLVENGELQHGSNMVNDSINRFLKQKFKIIPKGFMRVSLLLHDTILEPKHTTQWWISLSHVDIVLWSTLCSWQQEVFVQIFDDLANDFMKLAIIEARKQIIDSIYFGEL